ncbi:MAG: DUF2344 domain-containing protein [Spirochaetes bacterium]|nr:DUF2344 domain-containing protein [Spirochaetota bacterium]
MSRIEQSIIEDLISRVQRPGRYMGREFNAIVKDDARLRMALSYPDLYEVGMSNNGIRILYDILNAIHGVACERVFAAGPDFERVLRGSGVPLYTLETYTPLRDLDIIGFNMSHELLCTGALQILDLGGVPLLRTGRREGDPIVIAGGEAVSNPLPLSDFIDAFFIGDGEEGIREIAEAVLAAKEMRAGRAAAIERLGAVNGVLLPSRPAPGGVRKRVYRGAESVDPRKPLVPNIRIAQERAVIELTRGCGNFCNFCHAGFYELPYRRLDHRAAAGRIFEILGNTGYNEVTLSSLSISDYPRLADLINEALPLLTEKGVSVSLPSLRVDAATLPVIEQISELRRASLTFAVESASEEIRARANKRVFMKDLAEIVGRVVARGWKVIKLYFMIGLPGCGERDEAADIIGLLKEIRRIGGRGMDINVTVSPFVPKPHTPFQRERQMDGDYFRETVLRIKRGLPRSVRIKNHDVDSSILEGVLARGDARLGAVILGAYRDGCRLDSWDEHFRFDVWRRHLHEELPGWERFLDGHGEAALPWGVVVTGFERLVERRAAESASGRPLAQRPARKGVDIDAGAIAAAKRRFAASFAVSRRVRIRLEKTGLMRFIPHIDFMEIVKRALRMAGAPVSMTQGFNKRERISSGYPLPLGIESEAELVDVELYDDIDDTFVGRLGTRLPEGISVRDARYIDDRASLMSITGATEYRVTAAEEGTRLSLARGLESRPGFRKHTKKSERAIPFERVVHSGELLDDGSIILRLYAGSEDALRIDEAVRALAGIVGPHLPGIRIIKTAQYRVVDGRLVLIQ